MYLWVCSFSSFSGLARIISSVSSSFNTELEIQEVNNSKLKWWVRGRFDGLIGLDFKNSL